MPERNIDVSRGFNIGRQIAPGPSPLAAIGGGFAGGLLDRFTAIQQAKQQAFLEHTLRMEYDPEYRYNYQIYSQLNNELAQPTPQASPFGIDRATGYATGGQFAPGTQVNYAQPPGRMAPAPQQQFLQPISGQQSGIPDPSFLRKAAMAKLFPLYGAGLEAQLKESGRLVGQYGNPQEAARIQAGIESEKARTAVAQRQLQYPGLFKRAEMGLLPPVGTPRQTTITLPDIGDVVVTQE